MDKTWKNTKTAKKATIRLKRKAYMKQDDDDDNRLKEISNLNIRKSTYVDYPSGTIIVKTNLFCVILTLYLVESATN